MAFLIIALICGLWGIALAGQAQIPLRGDPGQNLSDLVPESLSPEILGMPRSQIAMGDRMIRLFNGRGGVCIRDKSLTGLQTLKFPPIDLQDYRFFLAFRETKANVLIQDIVPDAYDAKIENWKNPHPLGLNFTPGTPFVMLLQQAYWEPNTYFRTGTFHKLFGDRWISFGVSTRTNVSADQDEIYMEVEIENREADPLELVASPDQRSPDLALTFPNQAGKPAGPATHPDAFTISSDQIGITVVSDLPGIEKDGWKGRFRATPNGRLISRSSFNSPRTRPPARRPLTSPSGWNVLTRRYAAVCNGRVMRYRKSAPQTRPLMTSIGAAF